MSAYRGGFAQQIVPDAQATISTILISPDSIGAYELLMAEDEIVTTLVGDSITGRASTTYLNLAVTP